VTDEILPEQEWDKAFRPYALEIGFLLREWNQLQERLGSLFASLVCHSNHDLGRAIWHAIPNDRFQRNMLRELASFMFNPEHSIHEGGVKNPNASKFATALWADILWLVDSADKLGPRRDAAAHSPVAFLVGDPGEFVAKDIFGNPLAKSLKRANLLKEFRVYRERAAALHKHAVTIARVVDLFWKGTQLQPLPDRPAWPERPGQKKDASQSRQAGTKRHRSRRRSSRG